MRDAFVVVLCGVMFGALPGAAQGPNASLSDRLSRENRVVVFSPHFDSPLPIGGGLSCPSGPIHLYGFESDSVESDPTFRVRVFTYEPTLVREYVFPADGSGQRALMPSETTVRLTRRIGGGTEVELPSDTTWVRMADTNGLAVFTVPAGVYGIRFDYPSVGIGVGGNEGVVRVREARGDSLRAYLIPGAICE
jgi:hypothetical protein